MSDIYYGALCASTALVHVLRVLSSPMFSLSSLIYFLQINLLTIVSLFVALLVTGETHFETQTGIKLLLILMPRKLSGITSRITS